MVASASPVDRGGVLVVDKPYGPTSHGVVARARRALDTRAVGHAGTLDPAATGVLVLLFGEATKLAAHLAMHRKRYEVCISLGSLTDSLDAQGTVTEMAPVPELAVDRVRAAAESFLGIHPQRVPKVSAVKVNGERLYKKARAGTDFDAPTREVVLHDVDVVAVEGGEIRASLHCGAGYYVRSFARDLAEALGTVGHVKRLRRISSGEFRLAQAVPQADFEEAVEHRDRDRVQRWCMSLEEVWPGPRWTLSPQGAADARHGRPIPRSEVVTVGDARAEAENAATLGLFDHEGGMLLALGEIEEDVVRVVRGFRQVPTTTSEEA